MISSPDGAKTVSRKQVTIYTDGSCLGNPGPGGYAAILDYKGHSRELSGGFRRTTNNRMELLAVIEGLAALKEPCDVTLHSDSEYVVRAMREGWPDTWRKKGWRRNGKKSVANRDLWVELMEMCRKHDVQFKWVKGHAGHPENERCDQLALTAAHTPDLPADEAYERDMSNAAVPA